MEIILYVALIIFAVFMIILSIKIVDSIFNTQKRYFKILKNYYDKKLLERAKWESELLKM